MAMRFGGASVMCSRYAASRFSHNMGLVPKAAAIAFVSALDKAAKTKIIHVNAARRLKSSCAKYIFA